MQMNRLFGMVYILLNRKTITAKELADHFEVSIRTIYRDIETLSAAGIPVYANRGKNGGICLMENFVLNKSVLTDKEQNDILTSLQTLNGVRYTDAEPVLNKLSNIFNKKSSNWVEIDFSYWGSKASDREKFDLIKNAILDNKLVSFDYFNSYGNSSIRVIEPLKLIFKGQSWYIYGFCRSKGDFRIFKITRIKNTQVLNERFEREVPEHKVIGDESADVNTVNLVLKIDQEMAYRVYDEFEQSSIQRNGDGSFLVKAAYPEGEWVYGYVMSYGNHAEILEPAHVREMIGKRLRDAAAKYLNMTY